MQELRELTLAGTTSSPTMRCTLDPLRIFMQGDSYPENAFELFNPVLQWAETALESSVEPFLVELELIYLNTSSVRIMMELFDILEAAHLKGRRVSVNWYYDPKTPRVAELAEEFKEDLSLPFEILAR